MAIDSRVALIDQTGQIGTDQLAKVAAAIGIQVQRDLSQYWDVNATVTALPTDEGVPAGVWPVF